MALWSSERRNFILRGEDIYLRHPRLTDYKSWARLRNNSRDHLKPWEPKPAVDELTWAAYKRRVRGYNNVNDGGKEFPFFIFRKRDGELLGACNINNIRYGVMHSGDIGYWIGSSFTRKGYCRAAVRCTLRFAFNYLKLNRIEAVTRVENIASQNLLLSVGFTKEGFSRRLLKIDGEWCDHLRFAILNGDGVH